MVHPFGELPGTRQGARYFSPIAIRNLSDYTGIHCLELLRVVNQCD